MGNFIFRNKGFKEIYLTRNYNSLATFNEFNDDAMFNDDVNPFSDYCFQVTCGIWQNDKIKILSLPDKGRLFYLTNPGVSVPVYANVTIGQMVLVRDMIDYKVLKFNAEGSTDEQFIGNYLTEFKIERFCGAQSNNIISTVKLNMIDARLAINPRYNLPIPQTCDSSGVNPTNYDVYCAGEVNTSFASILNTSVGFVRMTFDGGTSELGLSKQGGGSLNLLEILPVSQGITATLSAMGINSPGAFPYGYPSQPVPANYRFQYSLDGINNWIYFYIYLSNA